MSATSRPTWKLIPLLVLLLASSFVQAQGRFTVNGRLKIEGGDLSSTRAVVIKDGVKERTISTGLNKFTLDLETGHNYIISFEKDGYVSKKISFNTNAPAEAVANGFTPFDFAVSLFKQYDDINIVVFNQPVGMIRYDDKTGDFDYDTDYTKSIQSQLQQVLAEVAQKQKEEAAAEKSKAAGAAQEAKAKAKAEAETQKQAEANAKAEAEARKQAETKAKAEAEAQKQAEAKAQAAAVAAERSAQAKAKADAEAAQRAAETQAKADADSAKRAAETKAKADADAARKTAQAPAKPEPRPQPEVKAAAPAPKPERRVVPQPVQRPAVAGKAVAGSDTRRSVQPVLQEEASRVEHARMHAAQEQRPDEYEDEPLVTMEQQTLVEPSRVTTVVTVTTGTVVDEYLKVIHKWGGLYYFKNGQTCTQEIYQRGTQAPQLAGATPRGKLD